MSKRVLTAAELAILQQRLSEASDALHQLRIGRQVARVKDSNGEDITYTAANAGELAAYIQYLERQIYGCHRPRPAYPLV